jgi:hypothetical protein
MAGTSPAMTLMGMGETMDCELIASIHRVGFDRRGIGLRP